jgi:4'-phosphopantetheinyl transferase
LWRATINSDFSFDEKILTADERVRVDRFRFENDRKMFRLAHGLLRYLLGAYLYQDPRQIKFSYTDFGKPYLTPNSGQKQIEFNLSHSGNLLLIAVTQEVPVGVDVEQIRPLPDLDQVAARFFSSGEQLDLNTLSGSEKIAAFFHCWTRKEAVIKACGEGLSMSLDSFQVSLLPGEPASFVLSPDQRSWLLLDLETAPGYAAAVAAPSANLHVSFYSADGI